VVRTSAMITANAVARPANNHDIAVSWINASLPETRAPQTST